MTSTFSSKCAPDLLASYNDKYGKNYQIPPADSYSLSSTEATILAGYNLFGDRFHGDVRLGVRRGVTYCVPVSIKTVSGGMTVLEPSRTLFIVLKTPVISKAIYLGSSNIYKVTSFQENSDLAALPQLTLETRAYTCSASRPAILISVPSWVSRASAAYVSAT